MGFLQLLELTTTTLSLFTFLLGTRQKKATWPVSIFISGLNFPIYLYDKSYGQCVSSTISILFSLYGWYQWAYGLKKKGGQVYVTRTSLPTFTILIINGCVVTLFMTLLSQKLGGSYYYMDSLRLALTVIGLWMTANKKVESYIIWLVLNILSVYMFYLKGRYFFAFKYGIYLGLAIYGFHNWFQNYQEGKQQQ